MLRRQLIAAARAARRILPSLGLAAVLLTPTLGPTAPARADDSSVRDPHAAVARIQVILKKIFIWDDRDPYEGEMAFHVTLTCYATPVPCLGQPKTQLDSYWRWFSAETKEIVLLDQFLPESAPSNPQYDASKEGGYPLRQGHAYELSFSMEETDRFSGDEDMGSRTLLLRQENGWAIGTHKLRSVRGGVWGDFELEVEIREAPVPDLLPYVITVHERPGSTTRAVCMSIANNGRVHAGVFEVALYVDGVVPRGGRAEVAGVLKELSTERCVQVELPTAGQHLLEVVVDEPNALIEYDETNNVFAQAYAVTPKQVSTSPQQGPTPSSAQADLTLSAIRINGQAPDGKEDCKDGKNDLAVVVKNAGIADAASFAVRLAVDGDEAGEVSEADLEAGEERVVRFDDVRLKKGERKLTATLDPKDTLAESNEDNNSRTMTATCRDD